MPTAAEIWRDFEVDGLPASGPYKPQKAEIRQWGGAFERVMQPSAAVADGVTNDAATINGEITAISADGGGTLVLPDGVVFTGSTPVVLKANVHLTGVGNNAAIVKPVAGFTGHVIAAFSVDNIRVSNLTVDMTITDRDNNGSENSAIFFQDCDNASIDDNIIINQGTFGIAVQGSNGARVVGNTITKPARPPDSVTTLNGAITNSATTLTLTNATGWLPANGALRVESEFIIYAALNPSTGVATGLTRGAYGTTAAAHSNGVLVRPLPQQHEGIIFTQTLLNINALVADNVLTGTAIEVSIFRGSVCRNRISAWTFGGGIVVDAAQGLCSDLDITDNVITGGYGYDKNDTFAYGIETWAPHCTVSNNVLAYNGGGGLNAGGARSVYVGNIIHDNAREFGFPISGILSVQATSPYGVSNSIVSGNISSNTRTTLAGAVNIPAMSLTLADSRDFPSSGILFLVTGGVAERVTYSAINRSSHVVTLTARGTLGSVAAGHQSGDAVFGGYQLYGYVEFAAGPISNVTLGVNTFLNNISGPLKTVSNTTRVMPANVVGVLAQSRIPFVVPSSGTMGNNGALSGITALQMAYPNAYVYLPANAIAAGSAAGWYYCVFSSTTAGQVFNNVYTSGTPTIPISPPAFATTGPGAYTQTTGVFINVLSFVIPGNTLQLNGALRVSYLQRNNNSGNGKQIFVFYGAYLFSASTSNASLNSAYQAGIRNCGRTDRQDMAFGNGNSLLGQTATSVVQGTVDSTADQNLILQFNLANAADTMGIDSATVELLPGV